MAHRQTHQMTVIKVITTNTKVPCQKAMRAFTLIELMVVLVIIGIVLTIGFLYLAGFGLSSKAKETTEQLQQVMSVANEQAILQPATIGMAINDKGYRFYQSVPADEFGQSKWVPLPEDKLSQPNAFDQRLSISVKTKTFDGDISDVKYPEIVFFPSGLATPALIKVGIKGKQFTPYFVRIYGSGTIKVGQDKDAT